MVKSKKSSKSLHSTKYGCLVMSKMVMFYLLMYGCLVMRKIVMFNLLSKGVWS